MRRPPSVFFTKVVDNINSSFCKRNLIYITNDYLYLDIPKSASSFIKSLIISSHKLSLDCGPQYPHSAVFERPRIYKDISNVKVISFIKDPIDRFCSVVREKFKLGSLDNNNKWSPYRFPLKSNTYKFNDVEKMIDKIETWKAPKEVASAIIDLALTHIKKVEVNPEVETEGDVLEYAGDDRARHLL